jgi:prolyl-tRNA synthetase
VYIFNNAPILILMLGNDDVNETKLEKILGGTIRPGHPDELRELTGADAGSIGPISFKGKIIADIRLKNGNNLFSGANRNDYHIGGIDLTRDVPELEYADLRTVKAGEHCIRCGLKLDVFSAIELGHIFKLGTKYSQSMGAMFLDENGKENPIVMGSYGIGVERIIACYVEQHHDENGIIWDNVLAPFQINLLALNMKKENVVKASDKIYINLSNAGFSVLYDDRIDAQAGFKFNDADLLGMPIQVIVGDKKLKENKVEVKIRETGERFDIEIEKLNEWIEDIFKSLTK